MGWRDGDGGRRRSTVQYAFPTPALQAEAPQVLLREWRYRFRLWRHVVPSPVRPPFQQFASVLRNARVHTFERGTPERRVPMHPLIGRCG